MIEGYLARSRHLRERRYRDLSTLFRSYLRMLLNKYIDKKSSKNHAKLERLNFTLLMGVHRPENLLIAWLCDWLISCW